MSAAFWEIRRNWITSCADQDAEYGLLGNPNRIDGMAVALEMILLWINREAQNKHFNQGAFYALRPEDLRRRPDVFVGVAASFCQQNQFLAWQHFKIFSS